MSTSIVAGGPGEFMTVRHLVARGTQEEIGAELATAARDVYGWRPRRADAHRTRARQRWFAGRWPQHHARMCGAARVFGLDFEAGATVLDGLTGDPAGYACSAVFVPPDATAGGHALLARNYDFFTTSAAALFAMLAGETAEDSGPPMSARPFVISSTPDDAPATTVLTMNELDGCMDGVNEHGLAVTLLIADATAPNVPVQAGPQVGLGPTQVPRFVLDTCATAEEARRALLDAKQYDLGAGLHYLIADPSGDAFVWERGEGGAEYIHDLGEGALCVTNHLLHRHPDPATLPEDTPATMGTYGRYRAVHAQTRGDAQSADSLEAALTTVAFDARNTDGFPIRTLWRTVADLTTRTLTTHFYLGDAEDGTPRYGEQLTFAAGESGSPEAVRNREAQVSDARLASSP